MIEPIHTLTFSMQSSKGVYALLIGSGVSRAAQILTGREITLDLIEKLAKLQGEACNGNPEKWYLEKYSREANYSELLEGLADTATERRDLLHVYFEPNEEERIEGLKMPTEAHRAIAGLAAHGFVRVVITTNFDRLIEKALIEKGIDHTVLSSPEQIKGALPLVHSGLCVLKVHGDYGDPHLKNTTAELAEYPCELNQLLDQIFDEFGLIVCGWSAQSDKALCDAIYRARKRRFTTFWTVRSVLNDTACKLVRHLEAKEIRITEADQFFSDLYDSVRSLEELNKPHPVSTQLTVARLKRYLPDPKNQIQLADLVDEVVEQAWEAITAPSLEDKFATDSRMKENQVLMYDASCATLTAIASIGSYYALDEHHPIWIRALQRLAVNKTHDYNLRSSLNGYPVGLVMYALGISNVISGKLEFLGKLLKTKVKRKDSSDVLIVELIGEIHNSGEGNYVNGNSDLNNKHIHDVLRSSTFQFVPDNDEYEYAVDMLEVLIGLCYLDCKMDNRKSPWFPPGAYWRRTKNRKRISDTIEESIAANTDDSPYVQSRLFGSSPEACLYNLNRLKQFFANIGDLQPWW